MDVIINDKKLVLIAEPKTFHFGLSKDIDNNMKYETDCIIKYNEFSVEHTIKNEISLLWFKYKHGKDIHKHGKQ